MRNIWRLFTGDLRRMGGNTITAIVMVGLVLLPSLFSWYNIIACWDVFDNTGHLTVAVANSDEGYESDLVRLKVNIGEQVVSALRANDQLNWVFTDEDDAIDGTRAGRYYAAVVIPQDFSRKMLTFEDSGSDDDDGSATIVYYVNNKKNAIAPKVTDRGADTVSTQVNQVFSETLAQIALTIAQSFVNYADDADLSGDVSNLAAHLKQTASQLERTAKTLQSYAKVVVSAQELVDDSAELLTQAHDAAEGIADSAGGAKDSADTAVEALENAGGKLQEALDKSVEGYAALPDSIDAAFTAADKLEADAAVQLRNRAVAVGTVAADIADVAQTLGNLADQVRGIDAEAAAQIDSVVARLQAAATTQGQLRDRLNAAADELDANGKVSQETRQQVNELAAEASASLQEVQDEYQEDLAPTLDELSTTLGHAVSTISDVAGALESSGTQVTGSASSIGGGLANAKDDLDTAVARIAEAAEDVEGLGDEIEEALASGDSDALKKIISADPSALAATLASPAVVDRIAVYPVENFGSAMTPLYTTLALWIGSLLIMVALKPLPSRRTTAELDSPTARQIFIGRFGVVAVLSLAQSTTMALGNLFFLEVQAEHPFLFVLDYWVTGLAFALIIYTLVSSFANLGKAISVLLLIVQVSGGGGSYPLQLLPQLIQDVSPFLPITHAVNAMRAAMFGIYQGDFWCELAILVAFSVPLLVLGLVFRKPLLKIVGRFVEKVEESKLM